MKSIREIIKKADNYVVESGIKSKARVAEHGEVYTPEHIVKDMMNMDGLKEMTYELDKTVLEPACGNGNFLVEIIARKLETASKEEDVKLAVFKAYSTVYGIDILGDNVRESRARMLAKILDNDIICERLDKETEEDKHKLITAIKFVMEQNIILGNALDGKKVTDIGESTNEDFDIIDWKMDKEHVDAKKQSFNDIKACNGYTQGSTENIYPFMNCHYLEVHSNKIAEDEFDAYSF